ncbi:MAG: TetR/AcrR family transcriptional regulator [Hespellia sp.]|nr:TetR/AcrR family transcriptional regulator [Hespellia sp.]
MAQKDNQRVRLTKMLLKNSLIKLMDNKSINQITIKELCEEAGLNRSTFYLHYTDQFALLEDIEQELMKNTHEYLKNISSSSDSLSFVVGLLEYIKEIDSLYRILCCRQENFEFQVQFMDSAMKNMSKNKFLNHPVKNKKYVYCFLMQGCCQMIREWVLSGYDISSKQMARLLLRLSEKTFEVFNTQ